MKDRSIEIIKPGYFETQNHFYSKVLNSELHPLVKFFLSLNQQRIINRYCHLNPKVNPKKLGELLNYRPQYFYWAGADLFHVTTDKGNRKMVVIETNSSPSGQKSMPTREEGGEQAGYRMLIEDSFLPLARQRDLPPGKWAVLYDKNYMEASGYAHTLAEVLHEEVYLIPFFDQMKDEKTNESDIKEGKGNFRYENGVLQVRHDQEGEWISIKAAIRYVTQRPWNRIPIQSKTFFYNPILTCLAGGRNKMLAAKAYDLFNAELEGTGLKIHIPETINDVSKEEIPIWVERFGGLAVIKIPYANAGQGVFTITHQEELDAFMKNDYSYDQFVVQGLIGNMGWSSISKQGRYYHVGTVPNKNGKIFVTDIRMMIVSTEQGLKPVAIYARKARKPLEETIDRGENSWEYLGTNLSVKRGENQWDTDTNRLLLMDGKDFNLLGLGIDNLIECYIQTMLSVIAIDKMAEKLINKKGHFKLDLFQSLDRDASLIRELLLL